MMTPEERAELRRLVAEYAELMTTGVNRLPAPAWWAAALPKTAALAAGAGALLDEVERLEAERDEAQAATSGLKTAFALAVRDRDANLVEIERLRAWEAEARAAMERAEEADPRQHDYSCTPFVGRDALPTDIDRPCTCHVAALRAVLARKVEP